MPNKFQPVGQGAPLEQAIAMFNNNFAKLDNEAVTKVFKGAGGVNAFTLGQIKDVGTGLILRDQNDIARIICYIDTTGTPILKVSKDGFDAITTGNENLIFNSAQNVFKIVDEYTYSITGIAASNTYATTPHGLSYTPAVLGFLEAGVAVNARTPLPTWTSLSRDDIGHTINFSTWINLEADATNTYIRFFNSKATDVGPIDVTVYLLQEAAS